MVIVMENATGKMLRPGREEMAAEEFGPFVEEVLNAGWLPQPEARLAVHESVVERPRPDIDTDEFLRTLYRNQE